ncbi:aminopeptidase N [Dyadobacter sp. BE34]|uniref:Aminopeptidase N n=1 Tax=Dyadobacter fermentans TaxID=94254 RepID=A0ABU1QQI5_9BACT|nr:MULTISPECIES: M1 family metallopeptidase [Dyadobacter]MDR6803406.1 aminopeptidase N [Dyadobacter fermentans]MDR7041147.1 aminopeptidase N [Dyadobacter sp. BE242]MDR7195550.1 aminopeptidase N [Dyadobacter sp. BE34]MDR7213905.1 aminopeptidase N [Dyadobacter sp. BE31]MDR7260957.1 aminopeptidase N [Dyadobacter sp. BE32]
MLRKLAGVCLLFVSISSFAQQKTFTHADTLRGSITPEREWWDLNYYHLSVRPNDKDSSLTGSTVIRYKVLKPYQTMQVDLQEPLQITKVVQDGEALAYRRDGNAFFITLNKKQETGKTESIEVFYGGKPRLAKRPPWDGGVQWVPDGKGNTIISTSCQGLGASVWWPCKDHMYDEPDSMLISITVPKNVMDVSNGNLLSVVENSDNSHTFNWVVKNPINNYGVNMNVANYVSWKETFKGEKGDLQVSYYVLPQNLEKAKEQFKQAPKMLKAFEHWFGPYPFYEDGYKLVEVPYLGMEHQSSVTYGNDYKMGYRGKDLSNTGWGLKWDFIIIHESGHEWFANNITYKDVADMWVHESFTNYSENLYTEYYFGKKAGEDYVIGTRELIANDIPIVGIYGVNQEGSKDMYYKGGNMLHTIRQIVNDDEKWRQILRGLNKTFYHQTVDGSQIENYISEHAGRNLSKVFDQYLRDVRIPVLEYAFTGKGLQYRWINTIENFDMPVKVKLASGKEEFLYPTNNWKTLKVKGDKSLSVDRNFYVEAKESKQASL